MLFAYLYLIRVPLVCGAFIAGMRYFALRDSGTATALLAGIFDVTPVGAILIGVWATWFTVSCVISADLTLGYAHDRFDVPARPLWVRSELRCHAPAGSKLRRVLEFFFQDIDTQGAILIFAYWMISIYLLFGLFHQSSPWTGWKALLRTQLRTLRSYGSCVEGRSTKNTTARVSKNTTARAFCL